MSKEKPAETLGIYCAQFGVKIPELVAVSGRARSTVDDWWRRQDYKMIDMAITSVLWNTAVTKKAQNSALKRKIG
ncbi:hypothetical protein [Vibrio harveyi]|uniref:hypothetical protein n=1 Tax=Vibrio harveyi group TaxID=717610 RepID=UPI00238024FD|nr:hypothetical protein [Vibrio harveyi]